MKAILCLIIALTATNALARGYANDNSTWTNSTNSAGTDSKGNSWTYSAGSGSYSNTNGHGCTGHGAERVCY